MKTKTFRAAMEIKADGQPGEFRAVFSTFNVIDLDGDVTRPGAFEDGAAVRVSYWGHRWQDLPVGRGVIHQDDKKAWVDGQFFMDTTAGKETYQTVKNLGELQEWSYGYDVEEWSKGEFEGQEVRFLIQLKVAEVSPVMLGAGIDTHTESIKGLKPYPNEHACRLREPGEFQADTFRRMQREHEGKKFSVIMGRLKGEDTMTEQAYRYADDVWTAAEARAHCKTHEGRFEAATGKSADDHGQDHGTGDGASDTPRSPTPSVIAAQIEIEILED
jgi:hypothetical protein